MRDRRGYSTTIVASLLSAAVDGSQVMFSTHSDETVARGSRDAGLVDNSNPGVPETHEGPHHATDRGIGIYLTRQQYGHLEDTTEWRDWNGF